MSSKPSHGPRIDAALERLDPALGSLEASARLRKDLSPEQARLALEFHQLRQRARAKMGNRGQLLLTKKGLEQATGEQVARYRAQRIARWASKQTPTPWIVDGTAGIGGDSMALLEAGIKRLVSNEWDANTARLLRANLLQIRRPANVIQARVESLASLGNAVLVDPDRRSSISGTTGQTGPREGSPARWSPAWDDCVHMMSNTPNTCIKLAPGVDPNQLALPARLPRAWHWISMGGELKELALWTGPWATALDDAPGFSLGYGPLERNVTVLARDGSIEAHWCGEPQKLEPLDLEAAQGVRWIAEPDPAVLKAGLMQALASDQGMRPLAQDCVYLGGNAPPSGGLLSGYQVLDHCPLDKKRVRAMLAGHQVGPLTVKKRGHSLTADELAKRYGGKRGQRGLLLVARLGASHHAYLVSQPKRKK